MTAVFALLAAQALLGAFDNLWHHEITERLPAKRGARHEIALHALREFLYAVLLFGLAWYEWRGLWVFFIAALLAAEIGVTLVDFIVEDHTRRLPPFERVLHTLLAINFGAFLAIAVPVATRWASHATAVQPVDYGAISWVFTLFAMAAFAWSVRNTAAVLHHRRPALWLREPLTAGWKANPRTVLISGATGFIGGHLVRSLLARGDSVIVWARDPDKAMDRFGPHVRIVPALDTLDDETRVDAIVNLAGAPILGFPWTAKQRHRLLESRMATTRALVQLAERLTKPPRVFVSASAVGYYGVRGDEPIDEQAAPQAIFQSELCQRWEEAAVAAESLGLRVVRLRLSVVLGSDGGALPQLVRPVRFGLGAILGSGRQWMSWIHVADVVRLIEFALETPGLRGPVNAVAPGAVTHHEFQRALARQLHRPMWLRVPAALLRLGLGEMAQILVDGQHVLAAKAKLAGFTFRYARIDAALASLLKRSVAGRTGGITIYYNGGSRLCRAEIGLYSRLCAGHPGAPQFIEVGRQPDALAMQGLRLDHLQRRLYLKSEVGEILSGMHAMAAIWRRVPYFGWLGRVVALPLVQPAAAAFYDHVLASALARRSS